MNLRSADLVIDHVYQGVPTPRGGVTDPLTQLLGVSRQGGFRYRGSMAKPTLLVLTSNLSEPDWPDELDPVSGTFLYYGDNRHPGRELHSTPRFGNAILRDVFDNLHGGVRSQVPPIFVFTSEPKRSFRFCGVAVPGAPLTKPAEDLIAIWKTSEGSRFQNYRAIFTILDIPIATRAWLDALIAADPSHLKLAPAAYVEWVNTGRASALVAPRTQRIRTRREQTPQTTGDLALVETIRRRYVDSPHEFERCAAEIAKLILGSVSSISLTRRWRDGGRDAVGLLRVGREPASIEITFALEAKCYSAKHGVGVREVSRLVSRLRHRDFGVIVTTSFLDKQAYEEVVSDGHPVVIICGADIANVLRSIGYGSIERVELWLKSLEA